MSPMLQAALGAIIRHSLTLAAGYLVSKGVWSQDAAGTYIEAATLGALSLGWSLYQKWKMHQLHWPWYIADAPPKLTPP